jgi:hypothetical protein
MKVYERAVMISIIKSFFLLLLGKSQVDNIHFLTYNTSQKLRLHDFLILTQEISSGYLNF